MGSDVIINIFPWRGRKGREKGGRAMLTYRYHERYFIIGADI